MTLSLLSLVPAETYVCRRSASFLQSQFWGDFKARFGWKPFAFTALWSYSASNSHEMPLLVLHRRLVPGFSFAYVPWGPELPPPFHEAAAGGSGLARSQAKALEELAARLKPLLPGGTVFIRFDLPWSGKDSLIITSRDEPEYLGRAFTRAAAGVQPPDTVIIDISPDEKELLARMKSKWRYNIGLAGKKGVLVRHAVPPLSNDITSFYKLYRETAARDGIAIHGIDYYKVLFQTAEKADAEDRPGIRLYLASHEGEDIAGIITLFRKDQAVYLYGASANHKRSLMAPYALQWRAIQEAKAAGCRFYDLYGIPPRSAEEEPEHPMAGLYRFKTGFGGEAYHRPGCRDYSFRPFLKMLYTIAEHARKKIRNIQKRREHGPAADRTTDQV